MIIIVFNASIFSRQTLTFHRRLQCNPFFFLLMQFANKSHSNVFDFHPSIRIESAQLSISIVFRSSIVIIIVLNVSIFSRRKHLLFTRLQCNLFFSNLLINDTQRYLIFTQLYAPTQLNCPEALSFDRHCNLYGVDHNNHRVQRFDLQ